jgi:hypothetical protein
MTLDRRDFLKMVGAGSFVFLSRSSIGAPVVGTNGPCHCVNIVLHGFFFMEFQGNNLLVASPPHDKHQFYYQDAGGALQKLSGLIDLTGPLQSGRKTKFPNTILQFSRKDIKLTRPSFIDNGQPDRYACLLRLPWPEDIVALRRGAVADLNPQSGNVASSIKRLCALNVATVTRLKYFAKSSPPFTTRNYFAEHCHMPKACEVNAAFDSARNVFGKEFDLTISGVDCISLPPDKPGDLPDEMSLDDERALEEVAPCPEEKCPPPPCPVGKVCLTSVEVATCPTFGVIS